RKQAKAPYRLGGMASPRERPPAKARPCTASGAITSPTGKSKPSRDKHGQQARTTASQSPAPPAVRSLPRPAEQAQPRQPAPASPHRDKPEPRTASGALTPPTGRASPAATSTASKPGPLQAPTGIPRKSPAPVPPLAT